MFNPPPLHAGGRERAEAGATDLANRVTAPATTGEATLVPDRERQPSFIPDPRTPEP